MGRPLRAPVQKDRWIDADEDSLKIILGGVPAEGGGTVPVLYRAQLSGGGKMFDPWGKQYQYKIKQAGNITPPHGPSFQTAPNLPNYYRLTDEERE